MKVGTETGVMLPQAREGHGLLAAARYREGRARSCFSLRFWSSGLRTLTASLLSFEVPPFVALCSSSPRTPAHLLTQAVPDHLLRSAPSQCCLCIQS